MSLKSLVKRLFKFQAEALGLSRLESKINELASTGQVAQLHLAHHYRRFNTSELALPFDSVAFRSTSQQGEDGILLYIFSSVGTVNKKCLEICAGDATECNTSNLIINHGWQGLLIDGDPRNVEVGREFFKTCGNTRIWPPSMIQAWITADNVNAIVKNNGISGEIDLLSLDMDGVDWWVWKALTCVQPRVVVLEFQDIWGPEASVTIPYKSDFRAKFDENNFPDYCGASLAAFCKLGRDKGYRLIGTEPLGYNAFFMRNDVGFKMFPERDPRALFEHPKQISGMQTRLSKVRDLEWVQV